MANLFKSPFNLNAEQAEWVKDTVRTMTADEKIGQILCPCLSELDEKLVDYYTQTLKVGSVMLRQFPVEGLQEQIRNVQKNCKIPLLISGNLEDGGSGVLAEGTNFSMPMGCAATQDTVNAYRLGKISCREAASVGVNWGFAPIVDIDNNFRNPITANRTFGSDPQVVLDMARAYIKAAKEENIVPTIKHFPGDGVDERDQHLLVSVNDLSADKWLATYGYIYKSLIDEGIKSIMVGHIALPDMVRRLSDGDIEDKELYMPASQSKVLLTKLLRDKLGYNGLIVTDSTLMVGYMQKLPRAKAIPYSIECGADIILFNRSIEEDIKYIKDGLDSGILTRKRLDEAVERVLALKVSCGLMQRHWLGDDIPHSDTFELIYSQETVNWTKECADKAITLVKDNDVLPISLDKHKRIYLNVIDTQTETNSVFAKDIKHRLEKYGFIVTLRNRKFNINPLHLLNGKLTASEQKMLSEISANTDDFISKYDLAMIIVNIPTISNATTVRINWKVMGGLGNDIPWYSGELPVVAVSMANPYHLLDIPMADVYVNTYSCNAYTLDALFEKLTGKSEFKGVSPVDAFCGHEDTKY